MMLQREELDQHGPFQAGWCAAVSVCVQCTYWPPPKLLHVPELPLPPSSVPAQGLNNAAKPLGSHLSASPSLGQHLSATTAGGLPRWPLGFLGLLCGPGSPAALAPPFGLLLHRQKICLFLSGSLLFMGIAGRCGLHGLSKLQNIYGG